MNSPTVGGTIEARIPHSGSPGFRGAEATAERGTRLDARAWLLLRGWLDPVTKIELRDPDDPTPYWLLSTRHPDELAAAVNPPIRANRS